MKLSIVNIVLSMVLLSSLFYVGVTSSIAVYDPYADYDQDGDIDIFDVVPMADAYGTTGDSTRNVTVVNLPLDSDGCVRVSAEKAYKIIPFAVDLNLSWSYHVYNYYWTDMYDVGSYETMMIYYSMKNWSSPVDPYNCQFRVQVYGELDGIECWSGTQDTSTVSQGKAMPENHFFGYSIEAPQIRLRLFTYGADPTSTGWVIVSVSGYLRA